MTLLRRLRYPAYLLILLLSQALAAQTLPGTSAFPPADQVFHHSASANDDGTWTLSWDIEPGFYLYKERLGVEGRDAPIKAVDYPAATTVQDPAFGESLVYFDHVDLRIDPGEATNLALSWQGCAEAGLCYPPQSATLNLSDEAGASPPPASTVTSTSSPSSTAAEDQVLAGRLAGGDRLWSLLSFFGLGLLLAFTPCVLPMLPILSAVVIGSGARRGKALVLSAVFVVVMALTYAVLGASAALAGANLQAALQTPWLITALALLLVALAFAMFGLYELQLPARLREPLDRLNHRQRGGSLVGAGIMGLLSALLVSPCMTAPLAGALIYIADTGNAAFGGTALFLLGLGMGVPLIVLALLGARLLPRPGDWMNRVKGLFGFILLGTAVYFLGRIVPDAMLLVLWGMLVLALGLAVWPPASNTTSTAARQILRTGAVLTILWGALMIIGGATGGDRILTPLKPLTTAPRTASAGTGNATQPDFRSVASLDALNQQVSQAAEQGRWTLLEFSADWCVSCKRIERQVFGNAKVREALGDVTLLRADVTENNAKDIALMKRFQVVGPPTMLLFGPDGKQRRAHRIVGDISAHDFLDRLASAGATIPTPGE